MKPTNTNTLTADARRMRSGLVVAAGAVRSMGRRGSRRLLIFGILMVMVGASLLSMSQQHAGHSADGPKDALGGPDGYALDAFVREPLAEAQDRTVALVRSVAGVVLPGTRASQPAPTARTKPSPLRVRYTKHSVLRGETLSTIAQRYRMDTGSLQSVNGITNPHLVRPGQQLLIPNRRGLLHVVHKNDTLEDISLAYKVPIEDIATANGVADPDAIYVNQKLFLPNAQIPRAAPRSNPSSSRTTTARHPTASPTWIVPVESRVSSGFGYRRHPISGRRTMHRGTDFACGSGATVQAARAGKVTYAGRLGGYGKLVVLEHGDGYETRYAHASRVYVRVGESVRQGQRIARSGSTGSATGPHLHFEVRLRGNAIDASKVLP